MIISTNSTEDTLANQKATVGFVFFQIVALFWILMVNFFTWTTLRVSKQLQTLLNLIVSNLAVCSYILAVTSMSFSFINVFALWKWEFGEQLCDLWQAMDVMWRTVMSWLVFAIMVDRCVFYRNPEAYLERGMKRARLYLFLLWIGAMLISVIAYLVVAKPSQHINPSWSAWPQCYLSGRSMPYVGYHVATSFLLPILPSCFMYIVLVILYRKEVAPKLGQEEEKVADVLRVDSKEDEELDWSPAVTRENTRVMLTNNEENEAFDRPDSEASIVIEPAVESKTRPPTAQVRPPSRPPTRGPGSRPTTQESKQGSRPPTRGAERPPSRNAFQALPDAVNSLLHSWLDPKSKRRSRWRAMLSPIANKNFNEDVIKQLPPAERRFQLPKLERKRQVKHALSDKQYYFNQPLPKDNATEPGPEPDTQSIDSNGIQTMDLPQQDIKPLEEEEEDEEDPDMEESGYNSPQHRPTSKDSGIESPNNGQRKEEKDAEEDNDKITEMDNAHLRRLSTAPSHWDYGRRRSSCVTPAFFEPTPTPPPPPESLIKAEDYASMKRLGFVVFCVLLCWLPFHGTYIALAICPTCTLGYLTYSFIIWVGYLNSAINPFLYFVLDPDFKVAAMAVLHCADPNEDYEYYDDEEEEQEEVVEDEVLSIVDETNSIKQVDPDRVEDTRVQDKVSIYEDETEI